MLRQVLGDFNAFTPQKIGQSDIEVTECGVLAELELFGTRIDWQQTVSEIEAKITG
jgi:hypothetical protein